MGEREFGATQKPVELYETIEHFCLGRRRLELFGLDRNMRDGWLTLGRALTTSNWSRSLYLGWFEGDGMWPEAQGFTNGRLVGSVPEIDLLRPKSPVRPGREPTSVHAASDEVRAEKSCQRDEDEERPLPEDLGEAAPPMDKEDEDEDPLK